MAFKVEQRIGISRPVDDVYEIVADLKGWTQWSPIHQVVEGELRFGAPVRFEEQYEGLGLWEIGGFVSDWSPLSHIHIGVPKKFYEGSLIRFFEFEELSKTGCSFAIGAVFSGFLSEREGRRYAKFLKKGFTAYCEALKARAEA
ncbi:SRPBCC domain-containing protein [Asticcacaulis tiandongensis]|uniref:SRPBCC domain-containing protein n=1 Tax=Asticcacaulis tiandongensis TaxID=2565365 RepID=UPI001128888E|nr:SRPBCC domain-containing protein [Asticcacaulis tiandongensis]